MDEGLSLPLSALNALRRQALEELSRQRGLPPQREKGEFHPGVRYENPKGAPQITLSVRSAQQITPALLALQPARIYLPSDEGARLP